MTEADELAALVPSFWRGSARDADAATYDEVVAETRLVWKSRGSDGGEDGQRRLELDADAFEGLDEL